MVRLSRVRKNLRDMGAFCAKPELIYLKVCIKLCFHFDILHQIQPDNFCLREPGLLSTMSTFQISCQKSRELFWVGYIMFFCFIGSCLRTLHRLQKLNLMQLVFKVSLLSSGCFCFYVWELPVLNINTFYFCAFYTYLCVHCPVDVWNSVHLTSVNNYEKIFSSEIA